MRKRGEAYAFLNPKNEKELGDIEKELIHVKENKLNKYDIHPELYIYVAKTSPEEVQSDLKEYDVGQYVLKAILPEATNEETARELGQAINEAIQLTPISP